MHKTPTFVLSLDCEGLWGMLDQPALIRSGVINYSSLRHAYEFIDSVLDSNNIQCTAAFVSAFAAPLDLLAESRDLFEEQIQCNPLWFGALREKIFTDSDFYNAGFSGSSFFEKMKLSGHEMAWHGSTHLLWCESTSTDSILREVEIFERINQGLGVKQSTMIFPRNIMGHFSELRQSKVDTVRIGKSYSGIGKVLGLCKEFTSFNSSRLKEPIFSNDLWMHPKGDFLNWSSGIRGLVPTDVTWRRWKGMVDNAVESNGHVHMWFHPHNIITCPEMGFLFKRIMEYVGSLIKAGYLINHTMKQHTDFYKS